MQVLRDATENHLANAWITAAVKIDLDVLDVKGQERVAVDCAKGFMELKNAIDPDLYAHYRKQENERRRKRKAAAKKRGKGGN